MSPRTPWRAVGVVITLLVIGCGGGDPAGPTPADQLDPASDVGLAYQVVVDTYAEYNSGNAERWVELRDRGSRWPSADMRTASLRVDVEFTRAEHRAGSRIDVDGCVSHGFADWPDVADVGLATGYHFTCETVVTDAIGDAGGLELPQSFVWVVADGEVVAVGSHSPETADRAWEEWTTSFLGWLQTTYPVVWDSMTFVGYDGGEDFPAADSIPTALQYLDEFVATQR